MKVMTLLGKRSEIIKLSLILKVLDQHADHVLVHTAETADPNLSDIYFKDLEIRDPDIDLREGGKPIGREELAAKVATLIREFAPDRILVMGSSLTAAALASAADAGTEIYQLDAGRKDAKHSEAAALDSQSAVLMPFTADARQALILDGMRPQSVVVTGSPIKEVLDTFADRIDDSGVMGALGVNAFDFLLVTIHQPANLEADELAKHVATLSTAAEHFAKSVLFVTHPDTARHLAALKLKLPARVRPLRTLNFFDFVKLEKNALAVISDSTGVQEECCVLRVPHVSLRNETVRPETIACGSSMLAGSNADDILRAVEVSIAQPAGWEPPAEYMRANVSQIVSKIVLRAARV